MLARMTPVPDPETYHFCVTRDPDLAARVAPVALATFREAEGFTLVLTETEAARFGFDTGLPMTRIMLSVFSALDGVGLTAGVATALAEAGIPCNMIAAYHHDHVFVPREMAGHALALLRATQAAAR
ncbi:ACT domain-containing protein [Amaricoccus solimangrovi]|uniref:ACT domain-containing protein n=2 Tax=Amaricoccus solimangrovi TaxID=2589815 RepID=A0A501WYF1_9RHOB|nr:ACT domain-containing protein [Amaricoccus solimangrovi]